MRKGVLLVAVIAAAGAAAAMAWRRDRRIGSRFVNETVNPFLLGRGLAGAGHSELGTLEHVGRRSGIRRLTPVHPVLTGDEVRIVVPLGIRSQWAQNVLAAGRCRIQLHDEVLELDEPMLVPARTIEDLPAIARWTAGGFGSLYLRSHLAGRRPGQLEPVEAAPDAALLEGAARPA